MKSNCRIQITRRQVMEEKILAALNNEDKVVIFAQRSDLDILINALEKIPKHEQQMFAADLRMLRAAAFPVNG